MLSIIEVKKKQYPVEKDSVIKVDLFDEKSESLDKLINVLYLKKDNGDIVIGKPYIKDAKVKTKILGQAKDKKLHIIRYKPRSGHNPKKGHTQKYIKIKIEAITI